MKIIKSGKIIILVIIIAILGMATFAYANKPWSSSIGKDYKEKVLDKKAKDTVLATVNNEKIYESEVAYIQWQNEHTPANLKPSESTKETIVKKIAKTKLVLAEAKKNNIDLSQDEKDKILKDVLESFGKNQDENQTFVDNLGMSKEEVAKIIAENRINSIIEAKFMSQNVLPSLKVDSQNSEKSQDGEMVRNKINSLYEDYKEKLYKSSNVKVY